VGEAVATFTKEFRQFLLDGLDSDTLARRKTAA